MIRRLRSAHRLIITILALLMAALIITGLSVRNPQPVNDSLPEQLLNAREAEG